MRFSPSPYFSLTGRSDRAALEAAVLLGEQGVRAPHPAAAPEALTILVVDDDADTRHYVGQCLVAVQGSRSVQVLEASDGADALRCLHAQAVDLVITDLRMPGLDGAGLAAALDADDALASLPVLFISGDAAAASVLLRDTRHFLEKPFNQRRLVAAVRALLAAPEGF